MSQTQCTTQRELFEVDRKQVTVDFEGGQVVTDAGLLPIRQLDRELGILAEAARRLPDPRSQEHTTFSVEQLLTQRVYQILAGYPDGNDANLLRDDPLFKTLVDQSPGDEDQPLASGSTCNRFLHAFTRREAEKPPEDREVLFERRAAQLERIRGLNEFLVDVFVRTRRDVPERIVIDLDPTDDAAHGHQQLTFWNGHYDQNQYFPLMVFEGDSGMPLGAWLRPGYQHANCGAADILQEIVDRLRAHWPEIKIFVRGDAGLASPVIYDYCEDAELLYAFGYGTNEVLKRLVAKAELDYEAKLMWWISGRKPWQSFHAFEDYQAQSWSHPRRIITKVEITKTGGLNRRFVVTNMPDSPRAVYRDFYVKRGDVPERPIGELKNGLAMDRLSSPRFLANAQKLMLHVLAYLLWALFREANQEMKDAAEPESPEAANELARMEVGTARARLFKVGALVQVTHRRIWFHLASHWPGRGLFALAVQAVQSFVTRLHERWQELGLFLDDSQTPARGRPPIAFAPLPLK
jgi:hypothetical protein